MAARAAMNEENGMVSTAMTELTTRAANLQRRVAAMTAAVRVTFVASLWLQENVAVASESVTPRTVWDAQVSCRALSHVGVEW